jgi:hypothetical protein
MSDELFRGQTTEEKMLRGIKLMPLDIVNRATGVTGSYSPDATVR